MMREIGITGGIGSGKSTVARLFEQSGYRVYYADDRAKLLYDQDSELKAAVKKLLGEDIYSEEDKLIRPKLAERVFADKSLLAKINALVHPAVGRDYQNWLETLPKDYTLPFVLKEAAILFEARTNTALDGVIMVYAPIRVRIARVIQRDGISEVQVLARLANQWADSIKLNRSDFVIYNDRHHDLAPQVAAAVRYFISK
jgi:dephospho-CoA kinase